MSHYNHRNVYHSATPLTLEQALAVAPTIGAESPHAHRSERYAYVPTLDVLGGLIKHAGFQIHGVSSATVRDKGKLGFEKHLIRLRRPDHGAIKGTAPELILINSHDGSTCFQLMAGMFRFACANGLVCGDSYSQVKIKHSGDIIKEVVDASYEVVQDFDRVTDSIQRMSQIQLLSDEREAFADAAMEVRFPSDEGKQRPFHPMRLLEARRSLDEGHDLWSTFNVAQENCTKSGLSGYTRGSNGRPRRTSLRDVNGIDQNVRINKSLHILAERMAELKEAA